MFKNLKILVKAQNFHEGNQGETTVKHYIYINIKIQ